MPHVSAHAPSSRQLSLLAKLLAEFADTCCAQTCYRLVPSAQGLMVKNKNGDWWPLEANLYADLPSDTPLYLAFEPSKEVSAGAVKDFCTALQKNADSLRMGPLEIIKENGKVYFPLNAFFALPSSEQMEAHQDTLSRRAFMGQMRVLAGLTLTGTALSLEAGISKLSKAADEGQETPQQQLSRYGDTARLVAGLSLFAAAMARPASEIAHLRRTEIGSEPAIALNRKIAAQLGVAPIDMGATSSPMR